MVKDFRLNQRVCRIRWSGTEPAFEFGTITKVTKCSIHIDGSPTKNTWHATAVRAIDHGIEGVFYDQHWRIQYGFSERQRTRTRQTMTVSEAVESIVNLRRLKSRIEKRARRK